MESRVERFCQVQGQFEGLASPHNQLLLRDFICAVFSVVGLSVELHSPKDWKKLKTEVKHIKTTQRKRDDKP